MYSYVYSKSLKNNTILSYNEIALSGNVHNKWNYRDMAIT